VVVAQSVPDFAKTAASDGARRAWFGVGVPIIGLVAVIITLAIAAFASFARDQDGAYAEASTRLVASGLESRARATSGVGLDYANWDAAFDNITAHWNSEWIEGNFYSSVVDGFVLFRADGAIRYSWFSDDFTDVADAVGEAAVHAAIGAPTLRRLARAPTPQETVAHTYARVNGVLVIVAVMPITREDDAARIAYNPLRGYDYLAAIDIVDEASLAQAGQAMSLEQFEFVPAARESSGDMLALPLTAADGARVGTLVWRHARPGSTGFGRQIGLVVIGLLCIGALTLLIARQLVVRQIGAMAHAEAALESSRVKAEFLAKVGHELRTPLNGIIGYAEIIQEETDSATARDDAGRIITSARHLHHLLNDILDQSHLDAGRIRLKPEVLPVAGLVAEVQGLMRPAARAANVTLTTHTSAEANYVFADHLRLRQGLLNLIGNAIKFAPRGHVAIKTRVEVCDGKELVVFDIVDDGIGIARSELTNLFRPFSQANAQISDTYGGTGLGLSISRDLARAMGGDIGVASEFGKGSTFSLSVPVASSSALEAA
jgi:signal transduction histidine kinase